jgi:hypothetical protein
MFERFHGRISEVLRSHHFQSGADLEATLTRYVWLYNQHLPQKALNPEAPIQAMKKWVTTHPQLFRRRVVNHSGPDTYVSPPFNRQAWSELLASVHSPPVALGRVPSGAKFAEGQDHESGLDFWRVQHRVLADSLRAE